MPIQDLGSIGELVAAVATLLTLIYLSIQIRQGSQQLRYSSSMDMWGELAEAFDPVYLGNNLELFHKGLADEPLSGHEEMGFKFVAFRIFSHFAQIFTHVNEKHLDPSVLELQKGVIVSMYAAPGIRRWWKETGVHVFPEDFQEFVEKFEKEADNLPESAQIWRRNCAA